MKIFRRTIIWVVGAFMLGLVVGCARWERYKAYQSPDGRYQVEILGEVGAATMPGQGGDVPGKVRLIRDGRVLKEAKVELASAVDAPTWTKDAVHIRMVADWPLE